MYDWEDLHLESELWEKSTSWSFIDNTRYFWIYQVICDMVIKIIGIK